ncbi:hypothetical protein OAQ98_03110 [Alphaproteobacteria bacterium]|nr:hypothetical protein [Alphaproteobacteria bacterium]
MTINIANNNPRINYTATSGQTVFTVPFEFFENTDIKVYVEGTLKTITTHYSVTGGNGSTGTVTLVTGATLNDEVTLVRDVPLERTTDLTANYNAASLDGQLDRIVAEIADLDDRVSRTIQINDYELASGLLLPALDSRKGKTIQFNTSTGALEVGPTGADLTAIGSVTSEIATLAGISGNITTVAGSNAQVVAVGNAMTSITAINSALSNVNTVAGGISNINLVGGSISDVNDVADSLGEISAVQAKLTNIDTVAVASTNIGTVAGSIAQVNNVSSKIADVTGVNTNMSAITTANANSSNINLVASSIDDVNDVGTVITKVTTVADNIANVNLVGPVAQYMSDVANNITAISAVAPLAGDLSNVTSNLSAIQGAATNATNAANSATAAANSATSIGNAETTTTQNAVAAANSAAAAATALDNFDDKYLGVKSSDPTVDNDGDALIQGALYFSSSSSAMQVYDGANWIAASSSGVASLTLFEYTATAGQTAFSGNDDNGLSMSFIAANLLVTMNGVILDPSDYTTTTGLTVTLDVGAAVGDVVNIYAFKSFQVADTVPATTGGTFIGPVTFNDNVTVGGTVDGVDIAAFKTSFDNLSTDIVSDTTPQLGGNLDLNSNNINGTGNINVTGTVTADGLHVNSGAVNTPAKFESTDAIVSVELKDSTGSAYLNSTGSNLYTGNNVGIGTSSPAYKLDVNGSLSSNGSENVMRIAAADSTQAGGINIHSIYGNSANERVTTFFSIDGQNQASPLAFGTGATESMRIDSSGNVGIGTSSPSNPFEVIGSTDANIATFSTLGDGGGASNRGLSIAADTYGGSIRTVGSSVSMGFDVNGSERMRIDSSGNLLVGTTSTGVASSSSNAGIQLNSSADYIAIARSNGQPLYLNRQSSDGTIIDLRKDGTTVGSIGVDTGDLHINSTASGHVGLRFGNTRLQPTDNTGAVTDGISNLGHSNSRFKDLYLSGGVYLGGTGSANLLDDFEEGTFTPTVVFGSGTSGITYSVRLGKYTKIGNTVQFYVQCSLSNKGSSTGNLSITGLPFTNTDTGSPHSILTGAFNNTNDVQLYLNTGSATIYLENRNTGSQSPLTHSNVNNNSTIFISGVYRTTQ